MFLIYCFQIWCNNKQIILGKWRENYFYLIIIIHIKLLHAKQVSVDIPMVETNAQMENTDGMVHIILCHNSSYRSKKLPAYYMIFCDI